MIFKNPGQLFHRIVLTLGLSDRFLTLRFRLSVFEQSTAHTSCPSQCITSEGSCQCVSSLFMSNLIIWVRCDIHQLSPRPVPSQPCVSVHPCYYLFHARLVPHVAEATLHPATLAFRHLLCNLENFPTFWHNSVFLAPFTKPWSRPCNQQYFLSTLVPVSEWWYLENKIQQPGVLAATAVPWLLGSLGPQT